MKKTIREAKINQAENKDPLKRQAKQILNAAKRIGLEILKLLKRNNWVHSSPKTKTLSSCLFFVRRENNKNIKMNVIK